MALFFFQAEDGIRDVAVTGVQTCALPILDAIALRRAPRSRLRRRPLLDARGVPRPPHERTPREAELLAQPLTDRKSTRLNSSHGYISYAVFCLKKKKKYIHHPYRPMTRPTELLQSNN